MDKIMEYYDFDYYHFIGINPDSSQKEIKEYFWAKAKRHHPDMKGGTKSAIEKMKIINHVNDILSDPQKRARYDVYRQTIKLRQKRYTSKVRVSKEQSNTQQSRGETNYTSTKDGDNKYKPNPGESKNDSETNNYEYEILRSIIRIRKWVVLIFGLSSIILFTWAIIYDEINYIVIGIAVLVTITVGWSYYLDHEPGRRIQDK